MKRWCQALLKRLQSESPATLCRHVRHPGISHAISSCPESAGKDYAPNTLPYSESKPTARTSRSSRDFSHPEQQGNNGHASELTWLTCSTTSGTSRFQKHDLTGSVDRRTRRRPRPGIPTSPYQTKAVRFHGLPMAWPFQAERSPASVNCSKSLFIEGTETRDRR